jgi:MYXO-CTERM domain-containing protein
MKASLRASLSTLLGSAVLLLAATSFAEGEGCLNDTDCPGAECGGEVCNWNKPLASPADPNKPYTCNPAGTSPKGSDGWCSDHNADFCKCKALGAKCSPTVYCSFTKPSDAPAGAAGGAASTGGASTGGASTGTAGTSVIGTAGSAPAGTGGSTGTAGTTSTGTAGTSTAPAAEDEGGCSVRTPAGKGGGAALGLGLLGLGYALLRRRRAS